MSNPLIDAAYEYLSRGLSVIALDGKAPNGAVHKHGLKDAIAYADKDDAPGSGPYVSAVFNHPRTTGIGILTGYPYFVIDIDGEEGAQQWLDLVGPGVVPDRWVATTGRGLHLWYADLTPRTTRKLGHKLDLKAEGGYVAAPPSVHPSGRIYEWIADPEGAIMEAPAAIRKLLDTQDFERDQRMVAKSASTRVRHPYVPGSGVFYASWGFEGVLSAMRDAEEGNRNAVLYWATCTMMDDDANEDDYEQLREAALSAGLTPREVRLTMRSARNRG